MSARPLVQRLLSPALSLAVACPTVLATALVPATAQAAPADDDEAALAEARAMFERGRSKYDTFDYEGAIDLWQQAYSKVPESQAGVRNAMVYNIALAQEKAFEVDKDVAHLRQAVLLLESWVASYKAMFKKTPETEAEVGKAQARIAELKARIAKIESGGEAAQPSSPPSPSTDITFDTGYTPPPEVRRERDKARAANRSEGLIAAGWTLTGIGAPVFLIGTSVLVSAATDSGKKENPLYKDSDARRGGVRGGIITMVIGAGMLTAGGILLGKGYKQKKAIEEGQYSVAPYFDRHGGGAAFQMRF